MASRDPESQSQPQAPLTPLVSDAVAVHEVYRALRDAGFSQPEALYLTACTLRSQSPEPPG